MLDSICQHGFCFCSRSLTSVVDAAWVQAYCFNAPHVMLSLSDLLLQGSMALTHEGICPLPPRLPACLPAGGVPLEPELQGGLCLTGILSTLCKGEVAHPRQVAENVAHHNL